MGVPYLQSSTTSIKEHVKQCVSRYMIYRLFQEAVFLRYAIDSKGPGPGPGPGRWAEYEPIWAHAGVKGGWGVTLPTICSLIANYLLTIYSPFAHYVLTICRLFARYLHTICILFQYCFTLRSLFVNYLTNVPPLVY